MWGNKRMGRRSGCRVLEARPRNNGAFVVLIIDECGSVVANLRT